MSDSDLAHTPRPTPPDTAPPGAAAAAGPPDGDAPARSAARFLCFYGLLRAGSAVAALLGLLSDSLQHSLGTLLGGAALAGLGWLVGRGSRVAFGAALVQLVVEGLAHVLIELGEGKGVPWVSAGVDVFLVVTTGRQFLASRGAAAPAVSSLRRGAYGALLVALLGLEALLLAWLGFRLVRALQPVTLAQAPAGQFQAERASYATRLTRRGPSHQPYANTAPPPGIERVTYPSGDLTLFGWLARPAGAPREARLPVVVYFHGGFSFGADDVPAAQPFLDAGNAVLYATLRGENGNPGDFELMYGELDDAAAAVRWAATRPDLDPARIYAFGHSAGGGVAALLSLVPDLPLVATGSAGGLYAEDVFESWSGIAPFDVHDARERRLRVLTAHLASMKRPHFAYLGEDDGLARVGRAALPLAQAARAPLRVQIIPGDHFSSLGPAEQMFAQSWPGARAR